MRIHIIAAAIFSLSLGGCTSSSRVDALDVSQPSMESTASVSRRPVPPADVTVADIIAAPIVAEAQMTVENAMQEAAPFKAEVVQTALVEVPNIETEAVQLAMLRPAISGAEP